MSAKQAASHCCGMSPAEAFQKSTMSALTSCALISSRNASTNKETWGVQLSLLLHHNLLWATSPTHCKAQVWASSHSYTVPMKSHRRNCPKFREVGAGEQVWYAESTKVHLHAAMSLLARA